VSALPVTFDDVLAAREFLRLHLSPTPLVERAGVSTALGFTALLKCESMLPTAAFKVRGGLNLLGRDPTAKGGVIAASTGNHGQSLAYAGKTFGIPVTIVAPRGANPLKLAAMRAHGATIVEHGVDFDEARVECERLARERRTRYVHSGNEPYLIAGVATASLEALEERSDIDVLVVPVGGGSGVAGACIVAKHMRPSVRVIAVQAEGAPAAYLSWRDRKTIESGPIRTFAEGLATRTPFDMPQQIMAALLDDFVLVSDDDLYRAMRLLLVEGHLVAEGAGAAATAAALKLKDALRGKTVALWVSGANATAESLTRALASVYSDDGAASRPPRRNKVSSPG
jgi:threonine dehydratase